MSAPRPFMMLGALAALEALALLGYAVLVGFHAMVGGSYGSVGSTSSAIAIEVAIFSVLGIGLLVVAYGWLRMSRWARGPFILAQLIGLLAGASFAFNSATEELWPGLVLAVPALMGIVLAFSPAVLRAYAESYRRPGSDPG